MRQVVQESAPPTFIPASAPANRGGGPTKTETGSAARRWIVGIAATALVLRLTLFAAGPAAVPDRAFDPDSPRYIELARNLSRYGRFGKAEERTGAVHAPLARLRESRGEIEPRDDRGLRPEIFRTPGYPFFIALLSTAGRPVASVLVAQAFLSTTGVVLVFLIGRRLFDSARAGLIASAIVALHPADIVASNSVLGETLFTTLLLSGLWFVLARKRPASSAGLGGILIGLSVLVRPISILVGPALAAWMLATRPCRATAGRAALVTVLSIAPAAAWMARNHSVGFGFRLSSVPTINALFYTAAYMDIRAARGDTSADWPATVDRTFDRLRRDVRPGEVDTFDTMRRLALTRIAKAPLLYGKVLASSALKFLTDHSAGTLWARLGQAYRPTGLRDHLLRGEVSMPDANPALLVALAWTGWNALLALLAAAGLLWMICRRHWAPLLLLGGILLYFLLATQANGLERFRLPVLGIQALAVAVLVVGRSTGRSEGTSEALR